MRTNHICGFQATLCRNRPILESILLYKYLITVPLFRLMASKLVTVLLFLCTSLPLEIQCSTSKLRIKAGYYHSRTELPVSDINSALFTHLIFGFAFVNSSSYELYIDHKDSQKFSNFTSLVKRKNPSVTTILSIWVGKEQSSIFFSNLSRPSRRKSFIESSIRTARLNGFLGLDLFGVERPNTSLDMKNLEALLAEWRTAIDSEAKNKNKTRLLLVMLGHPMPSLDSVSYPVDAMTRNLDWIHLKSYDYYMPTKTNLTYPQAALYDPSNQGIYNTNNIIQQWIDRGVPVSKLVLGLPYYGYAWTLVNTKAKPISGAPASGPAVTLDGSMDYNFLKWYLRTNRRIATGCVYDDRYVVNYCTVGPSWINFDDVEVIRAKVSYSKKMQLLGYFVYQVGLDENWVLSRAAQEEDADHHLNKQLLLTIVLVAVATFFLLLGTFLCLIQRRVLISKALWIVKSWKKSIYKLIIGSAIEDLNRNASNHMQVLSYTTIEVATDNFSSQNKLGEGGFGPVYKGTLENGQEIAVKRLSKTSKQGLEEFNNEVTLTANLQHVNLVRVLGYCTDREEKMLIYEYMPNKSLDFYLFDPAKRHLLDWRRRVRIIEGIIQGLLYLQEYSNFTIIHRDLKASNVLLDYQMNPKISDFGMARIFSKGEHEANTSRIVGTYGYVPPEYVKKGIYSMKYDIYSFGVLLLQIISGKRTSRLYGLNENLNLLEYAYELWKEGQGMDFIEPTLDDSSSTCKLLRCMHVALLCVQENPIDRPSMLKVSLMLRNETAVIVTPKRPAFSIKDGDESDKKPHNVRGEICSIDDSTISQVVPR